MHAVQQKQQQNNLQANYLARQNKMADSLSVKKQKQEADSQVNKSEFKSHIYTFYQKVREKDYKYKTTFGTTTMSTTKYVPSNAEDKTPTIVKEDISCVSAAVSIIESEGKIQFDTNVGVINSSPLGGHDAYAQGTAYLSIDPNDPTRAFLTITTQLSTNEDAPLSVSAGPFGSNVTATPAGVGYVTHILALKARKVGDKVELDASQQSKEVELKNLTGVREYAPDWGNLWLDIAPDVPVEDFVVEPIQKSTLPKVITSPFTKG